MISISGYPISNKEHDIRDEKNYIRLNNCGYFKFITKDMTIIRKNGRNDYQLIYIAKGLGSFRLNGLTEEVSQGYAILYRPGEVQHYTWLCCNSPELYWVHFTGFGAEELLSAAELSDRNIFHIEGSSILVNYYKKIIQEMQLKKPLYHEAIIAAFMELLVCMARKMKSNEKQRGVMRDESLHAVIELFHTDYRSDWNIEKLAGMVNLSPHRFMHNFKSYTGMSAMEYLTNIRIEKAKDFLTDSSLSIKAISDAVGYSNPLYFSTIFRKITGISPSEYRNKR